MGDLFENSDIPNSSVQKPLAETIRPNAFEEVVGQKHLFKKHGVLFNLIRGKKVGSFIIYGPPGTGKTTISRILAKEIGLHFEELKGIGTNLSALRIEIEAAEVRRRIGQGTVLFVDEIHRFNKSQQDFFLPYLENGTLSLIGATTENPNSALNSALLSRMITVELFSLSIDSLEHILSSAENILSKKLPTSKKGRDIILKRSNGDARLLLNMADIIFQSKDEVSTEQILSMFAFRTHNFAKSGEQHFDFASALQKAMRGSDVNGSLYWLARLLNVGEDPLYILRRILRTSYEDIGLADLRAQEVSLNALLAFERLGRPEGEIALAHAVIYIALAPKSNSVLSALNEATEYAMETSNTKPAPHLIKSKSKIHRPGAGSKYINDHETANRFSGQVYFPPGTLNQEFYRPENIGHERELIKRLNYFKKLRKQIKSKEKNS